MVESMASLLVLMRFAGGEVGTMGSLVVSTVMILVFERRDFLVVVIAWRVESVSFAVERKGSMLVVGRK